VDIAERLPGADSAPEVATKPLDIAAVGVLETGPGRPADWPGRWPRFRGPDADNVSRDGARLLRQWPPDGPEVLWRVALGEGYAGPAVANGRVYVFDYDQDKRADAMRCLSLADGKEIWRFSYPLHVKRHHGMSRTVPAVTDRYVVGLGPKCHVVCCDAVSGKLLWAIDLPGRHGTEVPEWYAGQCPLIVDGRAILAPGAPDALLMAVECQTGEVLWKTPNHRNWKMTHASIAVMDAGGRKTAVYPATGGVVGVDLSDGRLLWEYPGWQVRTANVPTPVPIDAERVFLSGGYNAGSLMLRIRTSGEQLIPEKLFKLPHRVFGADQQTPILYEGHLYGVKQNGRLTCLSLDGKPLWVSGGEHKFGLGPFLIADGVILALDDDGTLSMAEATPSGFRLLARAKVLAGPEAWGPMALVHGRLLLRDLRQMVCVDLRAEG
jgi:outer membrane protein assembly factor BamB